MSTNKAIIGVFSLLMLCFFAACKQDKSSLLSRKWKTVNIDNNSMKAEEEYYKRLLDTATEKNEMIEFFGTVDSFKKVIKADLAQQKEIQKTNMENSFMDFRKDNMVYFTSVDGIDSAKWRFEDNAIVLEDEEFTGIPNITRLSILTLSENDLELKMINQYDTSVIKLKSVKK